MGNGQGAGLLARLLARCVDLLLAFAAAEALPKAGWVAGVFYLLLADGLMQGRSVGKKLLSLRVVHADGTPCDIRSSMLRNIPFALGFMLSGIPYIGWLLLVVIAAFEFLLLFGSKEGRRLGDEIAATNVAEAGETVQGSRDIA